MFGTDPRDFRLDFMTLPVYVDPQLEWSDIIVGGQRPPTGGPLERCIVVGEMGQFKYAQAVATMHLKARFDLAAIVVAAETRLFGGTS